MNEHQYLLWRSMVILIDRYLNNETQDFYGIVGKLEGALDASEIKDKKLVEEWYDFWTPLETRRAIQGKEINRTEVLEELREMKSFLLKHLYQDC